MLKLEVERVPIKVNDFKKERSVTRKYMFHPLIFDWEDGRFRFRTNKLQMLGFLMCSHRSAKNARDSLWGLMNPYVKQSLTREEVKEFLETLVKISTVLPWEYYQSLDTQRDI